MYVACGAHSYYSAFQTRSTVNCHNNKIKSIYRFFTVKGEISCICGGQEGGSRGNHLSLITLIYIQNHLSVFTADVLVARVCRTSAFRAPAGKPNDVW